MTWSSSAQQYYDRSSALTVENTMYGDFVNRLFTLQFSSDKPTIDLSTEAFFPTNEIIHAQILSRSPGIMAGREELEWYFTKHKNNIEMFFHYKDGEEFNEKNSVVELHGDLKDIFGFERVILNILQRLCGISYTTYQACRLASPVRIAATRKTNLGLIDKKAIHFGGGLSHRLSLSDGILIKDTHLDSAHRDFSRILESLNRVRDFFVIEVQTIEEALIIAHYFKDKGRDFGILFDNFSPSILTDTIRTLEGKSLCDRSTLEASGGITFDTIQEFSKTGVDVISMGCLTTEAKRVDLSMKIKS